MEPNDVKTIENSKFADWLYAGVQSIGKHQKNLLYLLLLFFVLDVMILKNTASEVRIPLFGLDFPRMEVLYVMPIALYALIAAYYGSLRAMGLQFQRLKKAASYGSELFGIDCNNTLIDYVSLSGKFTFGRVVLGWFLMPMFLLGTFFAAFYQTVLLGMSLHTKATPWSVGIFSLELLLAAICVRVLLALSREAQANFLRDLRGSKGD